VELLHVADSLEKFYRFRFFATTQAAGELSATAGDGRHSGTERWGRW